jgi:hypothetical protein
MMSRRQTGQVRYLGDESTFIGAAQRAQRQMCTSPTSDAS